MKGILKNYIFNIIIVFANIIFPMLFFPYASRVLSPEQFGKYSFAVSVSSYFIATASLGVQSYGLRELAKAKTDPESFRQNFSDLFSITFMSSMASSALYFITVATFPKLRNEWPLFLVISMSVVFAFTNLDYLFLALENHKRRTIRLLSIRAFSLFFLFMFVRQPKDYVLFAFIMTFPELLVKLFDIYSVRKYFDFRFSKEKFMGHLKPLFVIFFYILSQTAYLNLDSTMLGAMKGNESVGFYSVAIKMTKIVIPLITSLGVVLSPRIIGNIKLGKFKEIFSDIELNLNFIFFMTVPAVLLMGILADNLVILFSGTKYLESIFPMRVMLPIIIFISLSSFSVTQVLIPTNNEKKVLKVALIGLTSNLVLNFIFIPKFSIVGAAVATLISEFLVCFFRTREVNNIFDGYKVFGNKQNIYIKTGLIAFLITGVLKYLSLKYFTRDYTFASSFAEFLLLSLVYGGIYMGILCSKKEYFTNELITMINKKILKRNI